MSAPIFRWVGSKRAIAARIVEAFPTKFGTYYEPFCGAASVYFTLAHERLPHKAVLSDINPELMITYNAIRNNVHGVVRELQALWQAGRSEDYFYRVRQNVPKIVIKRAARFLYLQALSFNGLWRENAAGYYNVPYGRRPDVKPYDRDRLVEASKELKHAELLTADAFEVLTHPERGDLVYVDSPFLGTFSGYNGASGVWSVAKATQLAEALHKLTRRGVHVVMSEADTPVIRKLYKGATIHPINSRQGVAARSDARGVRRDVLVFLKR